MTHSPRFLVVTDLSGTDHLAELTPQVSTGVPHARLQSLPYVASLLEDLHSRVDAYGETLELLRPVFGAAVAEDGEVVLAPGSVANVIHTGADALLLRRTLNLTNPFHPHEDEDGDPADPLFTQFTKVRGDGS